jgi:putative transposase
MRWRRESQRAIRKAPEDWRNPRRQAFVYAGEHLFRGAKRLAVLHRGLLKVSQDYGWRLEAWAVFSNHYHFVAHSPSATETAESLSLMLKTLHVKTSGWVNRLDATPTRQVWFNFFETKLTYPRSYLARLNYTHQNPVRHKLVAVANQYPWCSAAWFERTASLAQVKTIYRFKTEQMHVPDEFDPAPEWENR